MLGKVKKKHKMNTTTRHVAHIPVTSTLRRVRQRFVSSKLFLDCTLRPCLKNEITDKMSKPPQGCKQPNAQLGRLSSDSFVNR